MLKRNPPWSWIAWMSAPVGPPHVEMHDSSDWKLFVLPPQPPYENNRHRSASCQGKFLASLVKIGFGTPFALNW